MGCRDISGGAHSDACAGSSVHASGFPDDDEGDSSLVFHADAGRNALKGVRVLVDHGVSLGAKSGSSCVVLLDVTKDMVWRVHILLCRL